MSIAIQIFELYFRRRSTPDIAYNPMAAILLIFITIAVYTVAFAHGIIFRTPMLAAFTATFLDLAIIYAILRMHDKQSRYIQMITASMGVAVIGTVLVLIIANQQELVFLGTVVQFWGFYLAVLILKDSLDCSFFKSLALNFLYMFIALFIILQLFGDQQAILELQRQSQQQFESSAPNPSSSGDQAG